METGVIWFWYNSFNGITFQNDKITDEDTKFSRQWQQLMVRFLHRNKWYFQDIIGCFIKIINLLSKMNQWPLSYGTISISTFSLYTSSDANQLTVFMTTLVKQCFMVFILSSQEWRKVLLWDFIFIQSHIIIILKVHYSDDIFIIILSELFVFHYLQLFHFLI